MTPLRLWSVLLLLATTAYAADLVTLLSDIVAESGLTPGCFACQVCPPAEQMCTQQCKKQKQSMPMCEHCPVVKTLCEANCRECITGNAPVLNMQKIMGKAKELMGQLDKCTMCSACPVANSVCDYVCQTEGLKQMCPSQCTNVKTICLFCSDCQNASLSDGLEKMSTTLRPALLKFMGNMRKLDRCSACKICPQMDLVCDMYCKQDKDSKICHFCGMGQGGCLIACQGCKRDEL